MRLICTKIKKTIMIATFIKKLEDEFSHNYYMYIPLTIILQSCVGSIAAMFILYQGTN